MRGVTEHNGLKDDVCSVLQCVLKLVRVRLADVSLSLYGDPIKSNDIVASQSVSQCDGSQACEK